MKSTLFAALIAVATAAPATAQAPAPAVPPAVVASPESEDLARQLVAMLNVREQMLAPVQNMEEQMRSGVTLSRQADANPAMRMERAKDPAKWDAAFKRIGAMQADALRGLMTDIAPQVETQVIDSYSRHFTAEQLRGLIAFYETPLGQTVVKNMPVIAADGASFMQQVVMPRMQETLQQLRPQIESETRKLLPRQPGQ
jgi:hypothetical protein